MNGNDNKVTTASENDSGRIKVYHICVFNTFRNYYSYIFDGPALLIGLRVLVPFRKQMRIGIIVGQGMLHECKEMQLRFINSVLESQPILPQTILDLCKWVATYYQSPLSEVIPLALPKRYRELTATMTASQYLSVYTLAVSVDMAHQLVNSKAYKQHALIDFISNNKFATKSLILKNKFTNQQLNNLITLNVVVLQQDIKKSDPKQISIGQHAAVDNNHISETTAIAYNSLQLNEQQLISVTAVCQHLEHYRCFLLQGVTGSGKTEVYLEIISQVILAGKQVLVLVPEIGLTPQLFARFKIRFSQIGTIHSELNDTERLLTWQQAKDNNLQIVVGTRSAVFTPLPNLGLIVIDEEHDLSFKQMDSVYYSARDTALMRAYMANIPIILGSATPSLEALHNCQHNKYTLLRLDNKALNQTPLHYHVIDTNKAKLHHGLAVETLDLIARHLTNNNQVMVFINRRGFAPVLFCHNCHWIANCFACDIHLTLHSKLNRLVCHYCGCIEEVPIKCRKCNHDKLLPIGAGTQRIDEFLNQYFPQYKILRIDRDSVRKKNELNKLLTCIKQQEVQLIIGTQMLAKGHHFPNLTLVVILNTDASFYNQDFRALERLGQLLIQVSGRAGRAEYAGQVVIQTLFPQHELLKSLLKYGYEPFAGALLQLRQAVNLPPYSFLALIHAQDKSSEKAYTFLQTIKKRFQETELTILGPAPAPLSKKANYYRMQLLIKSTSRKNLQAQLNQLRHTLAKGSTKKLWHSVRWHIDVDPLDLS